MYAQGIVLDPSAGSLADGQVASLNFGRSSDLIVSELHGKYFQQCYRGNVFYSSTASTGVVIPISTTLTPTYSLWNPAGSGKLCVPIALLVGWTSTTAALGTLLWTSTTNAGSGISSTAPFVAFGTGTPVNANLGSGKVSQMRAANGGTTTLVAAASVYRETGLSIGATTAATAILPGWQWRDDFDGTSIIPPSTAIHLMASTAIAVALTITLIWEEVPL